MLTKCIKQCNMICGRFCYAGLPPSHPDRDVLLLSSTTSLTKCVQQWPAARQRLARQGGATVLAAALPHVLDCCEVSYV